MTFQDNAFGKRVLVVDENPKTQNVRALRLGERGVAVDTVSTFAQARSRLRDDTYDLVLLAAQENPEDALAFRLEIRERNPKQHVAFMVGPPQYISFRLGKKPSRNWAEKLKGRLASA